MIKAFGIFVFAAVLALSQAQFDKLVWIDCGSPQVKMNQLAITPMPILQPGNATLTMDADFLRGTSGPLVNSFSFAQL